MVGDHHASKVGGSKFQILLIEGSRWGFGSHCWYSLNLPQRRFPDFTYITESGHSLTEHIDCLIIRYRVHETTPTAHIALSPSLEGHHSMIRCYHLQSLPLGSLRCPPLLHRDAWLRWTHIHDPTHQSHLPNSLSKTRKSWKIIVCLKRLRRLRIWLFPQNTFLLVFSREQTLVLALFSELPLIWNPQPL